jgi:hypothetical protein
MHFQPGAFVTFGGPKVRQKSSGTTSCFCSLKSINNPNPRQVMPLVLLEKKDD